MTFDLYVNKEAVQACRALEGLRRCTYSFLHLLFSSLPRTSTRKVLFQLTSLQNEAAVHLPDETYLPVSEFNYNLNLMFLGVNLMAAVTERTPSNFYDRVHRTTDTY